MRNLFAPAFLVILIVLSGSTSPQDRILSKRKSGLISIGMNPNEIYSLVGKENTTLVDLYLEAMYSPTLVLKNKKKVKSLEMEIVCEKVWRINVYDPEFKTLKGVGVGSTLGDLKKNYKVNSIEIGEAGVFAYVEELDMSFALNYRGRVVENLRLEDIPSEVAIYKILIL